MADPTLSVKREGDVARVIRGRGFIRVGSTAVEVTDTGNGFVARFPASDSTKQDYWLCMDYSQAHELILGLSAFKKELGYA